MEEKLIIELDGGQHADNVEYDRVRDSWLRGEGYMVLRFWSNEMMNGMEGVLGQIRLALIQKPLSLDPSDETTSHSTKRDKSVQVAGYPVNVRGEAV